MSTLRELLDKATPPRWYHLIDDYGEGKRDGSMFLTHEAVLNDAQTPLAAGLSMADAALIVYLVNRAERYLALETAARRLLVGSDDEGSDVPPDDEWDPIYLALREALEALDAD